MATGNYNNNNNNNNNLLLLMLILSLLSISKDATLQNLRTKATLRRRGSSLSHALTVLVFAKILAILKEPPRSSNYGSLRDGAAGDGGA